MEFHAENVPAFMEIWHNSHPKIAQRPGCHSVALHHDARQANVLYTVSQWESEEDLNAYRDSDLFGQVWPATKALFSAPAKAFSLTPHQS